MAELIQGRICIPCWECHQPTRTSPCEHCHCERPEANREQYDAEEKLMAEVFRHMGHCYRLRVPHDVDAPCTLVADPRWPVSLPQTIHTVPLRIVEFMKRQPAPGYAIARIAEFTDHYRTGWREMGLDGSDCDWYACLM